jgi:hypothetical protein
MLPADNNYEEEEAAPSQPEVEEHVLIWFLAHSFCMAERKDLHRCHTADYNVDNSSRASTPASITRRSARRGASIPSFGRAWWTRRPTRGPLTRSLGGVRCLHLYVLEHS